MEWLDGNKIQIIPPKRPKKLTGTRFATILGLNPWSTPFEIWCEVTRTYQKPFEDTIYTIAGKTIEPKQAEYMKQTYFMSNLVTPTDIWGKDYFRQTYGDFFRESPVLGGMWDYLLYGKDGKPTTVLEMKTSKRVEDWKDDIPEYYALQAALYAWTRLSWSLPSLNPRTTITLRSSCVAVRIPSPVPSRYLSGILISRRSM